MEMNIRGQWRTGYQGLSPKSINQKVRDKAIPPLLTTNKINL